MKTTIIIPISRPEHLPRLFSSLEFLNCDREDTNILTLVDGDLNLYEKARNFTVKSKFKERLCLYRNKGQANVSHIKRRRQRIADIHNEMKSHILDCDYIFMTEDDTYLPSQALENLLELYTIYPHAGFVSGMQIGRWGYDHIGAWKVNDVYNIHEIKSIKDIKQPEEIPIDAAGFYCCLTKRENYMRHAFEPFEEILGPDFHFGIKLRQEGFFNYIDPRVKCNHMTKKGDIDFLHTSIIEVTFNRVGDTWELHES